MFFLEIIKEHTTSICPECYEKIDARVVAKDGKAVMEKECARHGFFEAVVEKDLDFYRTIAKAPKDDSKFPTRCLMINATHACNLNCHLCYIPERSRKYDFSADRIKEAIVNYPGKLITFSGGEPTLREDLPELITFVRKQKKAPLIVSNGIKLADYDYLKSLQDAGLVAVNFSCNGFSQKAFLGIENAPLLETKMKTLENLKKLGIRIQFSFTMSEGINDDQFGKVLKYITENTDFVYQLRTRVSAPVGKHLGNKTYFLSDFLNILAKEMGSTRDKLVDFWLAYAPYPNPYIFQMNYFLFYDLYAGREMGTYTGGDLVLFSWPDKYSLDYEEIKALDLDILTKDLEYLNFWDGVIRNEKFNFI